MSLGELLKEGGWAMYPIYLCSLVGAAIFVRKMLEFRSARLSDVTWVDTFLDNVSNGNFAAARSACSEVRHPAARVVTAVIDALERRPDRAEAEAVRCGGVELQAMERHLGALSFIAQVAPLLGLLGTVLGMVDLFLGLQGAGGSSVDASMLSSGIWKALLTTAAGLLVAVPALAAHAYLTSVTDRLRLQMGDFAQRTITAAPVPVSPTGSGPVPGTGREAA